MSFVENWWQEYLQYCRRRGFLWAYPPKRTHWERFLLGIEEQTRLYMLGHPLKRK